MLIFYIFLSCIVNDTLHYIKSREHRYSNTYKNIKKLLNIREKSIKFLKQYICAL